jgi:hypothetical protein
VCNNLIFLILSLSVKNKLLFFFRQALSVGYKQFGNSGRNEKVILKLLLRDTKCGGVDWIYSSWDR